MDVKKDKLYIKAKLDKSIKKVRYNAKVIRVMMEEGRIITISPHLTLRICLLLHAKPFYPLGLVLPTRMIGSLLFRETLQSLKKEQKTNKNHWDDKVPEELIE